LPLTIAKHNKTFKKPTTSKTAAEIKKISIELKRQMNLLTPEVAHTSDVTKRDRLCNIQLYSRQRNKNRKTQIIKIDRQFRHSNC
jgi:hypothetical protein